MGSDDQPLPLDCQEVQMSRGTDLNPIKEVKYGMLIRCPRRTNALPHNE
jgi:hypothetical protein